MLKQQPHWVFIAALSFLPGHAAGQSFLNGSFELHTINGCGINMTNAAFSGQVSYVNAFGEENEPDFLLGFCGYGNAHHGNAFVALNADTAALDDFRVLIFDRWGGLVYESKSSSFRWGGSTDSLAASCSPCTYMIQYRLPHESAVVTKSGSLAVTR